MLRIWKKYNIRDVHLNSWDVIALVIVLGVFALLALGAHHMDQPYHVGQTLSIHLSPYYLPYYALRTVLRMLIAMGVSLLFTLIVATLAAKNRHAERLIIPAIDILQSVPILGFLSITVIGFIALFRGSLLGPECAAIFAIFTSQVWNITLGFYQSLKTVPKELQEAADIFHLSSWQRFWQVEVPCAIPSLIWNMMISMSGGWFFVVASEAISVNHQTILLPGIGSYIAQAISHTDKLAVMWAIIAMIVVIFLYDQLMFRPLIYWSERFKFDTSWDQPKPRSLIVSLMQRAYFLHFLGRGITRLVHGFINLPIGRRLNDSPYVHKRQLSIRLKQGLVIAYYTCVAIAAVTAAIALLLFIVRSIGWQPIPHVLLLGVFTAIRVFVLIFLSSLFWVPISVKVGMNPKLSRIVSPIAQFLAAFPANLLFPIVVVAIVHFNLNPEIWTAPLMILGTQWYIVFNVIAGAASLPKELYLVTRNFQVKGWLWWKKFILPGILPFYITGAMTAAGGAWNASIVAEVVSWGGQTIKATGLGAYITTVTAQGNFAEIALGISVMCLYVLLINRLVWQPLYNLVQKRFQN